MDLQNLLHIAKSAAQDAGTHVMDIYQKDFDVEFKEDKSPITKADKTANRILQKHLTQTPHPIRSEESKDGENLANAQTFWVIDPIDGTKDFVNKTGEFSIMIGLVHNGEPILGVVHCPALSKSYFAIKWAGAYTEENGQQNRMMASDKTSELSIVISRNHTTQKELDIMDALGISKKIPCGSIGIKMSRIANNLGDIYINLSDKASEWDTAASHIILKEAGGEVSDWRGQPLVYNQSTPNHKHGCIATNGVIHKDIIQELNK